MVTLEAFNALLRQLCGMLPHFPVQSSPELRNKALAYVAPAHNAGVEGGDPQAAFAFEATRQGTRPRRYVGRASTKSSEARGIAQPVPIPQPRKPTHAAPTPTAVEPRAPAQHVRQRVTPWSLRLVAVVSLILGLALAGRVLGIFTPPVDATLGVEATHAAFSNVLAGRVAAPLDPIGMLPPPAPWYGPAPSNPTASLPVYNWLTAGLMSVLGVGDWIGRALSILFSLLAGVWLFVSVRDSAGARSALYGLLLFSVAPFSIVVGQRFSPASLLLAAQALAMCSLIKWRNSVTAELPHGSAAAFAFALAVGAFAALIDPGSLFLAIPAAYILIAPGAVYDPISSAQRPGPTAWDWRGAWNRSANRGKFLGYIGAVAGPALLWWAYSSGTSAQFYLAAGDGGDGLQAVIGSLFSAGTYVQIVGVVVERMLTLVGLMLLLAGLLQGARPPLQLVFHTWLLGGLLHVLADAGRLDRHDEVLLPLLLPLCALVGIGAAWAGALPARVWLAVTQQKREHDAEYAVSPHTSWLLDLPEELAQVQPAPRPQAQLALGRSIAQRAQRAGARARRTWLIGVGHIAVLAGFGIVALSGVRTATVDLQSSPTALKLLAIGAQVQAQTPLGARLIIVGPYAPELFYSSSRTGWALQEGDFNIATIQSLQREGAGYLLSADQEWLGRHADYLGLLTNYSVKKLSRDYILFDLNSKPAANNRLYFLETGHTLGGDFRRFWEQNGGVRKLGYPISEELEEQNPLDGQLRKVQYFERAVLEYHPEYAGTPDVVMLASVGLWVTQGRDLPRVPPFQSTPDRAYFPQTGHSVKEAFLRFWQREGGVALFGYPISEELPEISAADGKVYTVQYFERARFEWHPTDAGTAKEVQLGLIGKQALEMRK